MGFSESIVDNFGRIYSIHKGLTSVKAASCGIYIYIYIYICIYTMEYYSAIKKNEIMPFAAKWMDLEIIILSEVSQTKTNTL